MKNLKFVLFICFLIIDFSFLKAEEINWIMTSQLRVVTPGDEGDQTSFYEHNLYDIEGVRVHSSLDQVQMLKQRVLELEFEFNLFEANGLTCDNYLSRGYQMEIAPSKYGNYHIVSTNQGAFKNVFSLASLKSDHPEEELWIHLINADTQDTLSAAFSMVVVDELQEMLPGMTTLYIMEPTYLDYPVVLQMSDPNNPTNLTQSMLFGPLAPDTILIESGKSYDLNLEIENWVSTEEGNYTVIVNADHTYGHEVRYKWNGPALKLSSISGNGLRARLEANPGRSSGRYQPVDPNLLVLNDPTMAVVRLNPNYLKQSQVKVNPVLKPAPRQTIYDSQISNQTQRIQMKENYQTKTSKVRVVNPTYKINDQKITAKKYNYNLTRVPPSNTSREKEMLANYNQQISELNKQQQSLAKKYRLTQSTEGQQEIKAKLKQLSTKKMAVEKNKQALLEKMEKTSAKEMQQKQRTQSQSKQVQRSNAELRTNAQISRQPQKVSETRVKQMPPMRVYTPRPATPTQYYTLDLTIVEPLKADQIGKMKRVVFRVVK